jgi:hypothetical protein
MYGEHDYSGYGLFWALLLVVAILYLTRKEWL